MSHMNVVKSYAWEDSFLDRIMNVRRSELEWIKKNSLLNGFNAFVIGAVPVLVTVATFAVYISMGNNLTAATAFTSISLFNVLRMPLIMLPQVITQWTTAQVCT
jgi:ABC-type multidrug transport system fused ATPase/permease subunit